VNARLSDREFLARAVRDRSLAGEAVFRAYFGDDVDAVDERFRVFVSRLVAPSSRDRIVQGEAPRGLEPG
jgi:hypothetical protein